MLRKPVLAILVFLLLPLWLTAAEGDDLFQDGLTHFQKGEFTEAYRKFTRLAEEETFYYFRANATFWQGKTLYMMGAFVRSQELLDQYLINWPDNTYYEEANYLLAKNYYQQKNYTKALDLFLKFTGEYGSSSFIPHALYWMGESLYQLGQLEEARQIYNRLLREYPASTKVEAARYRFSLIEIKEREEKLLELLKWSHEEFLKSGQENNQAKMVYEEALKAYQEQIITMMEQNRNITLTQKLLDLKERALELKAYYLDQKEERSL